MTVDVIANPADGCGDVLVYELELFPKYVMLSGLMLMVGVLGKAISLNEVVEKSVI